MDAEPERHMEKVARKVRKLWFDSLTEGERDRIIKPHFEEQFPSDKDKRKFREELERTPDWYK